MKKLLLLCLIILSCSRQQAQYTEYVVLVVIDGSRYSETFGDSIHTNIPRIWNQLRPFGTVYTSFYNEGLTETNPGHAAIVTGTWQSIANDGSERPSDPTIFEYYRKQKNADTNACWVVLGKSKLNVISGSTHPDYGLNYAASVRTSESQYDDSIAWENTGYVLSNYHPRLTIVNFPKTDNAAHEGDWSGYIAAIQRVDTLIASLWTLIQTDPILQNKTTMIITNDHGRHTADFTSHGDGCDGCRRIMLLIIGPDTPAGIIDSISHSQIDIAPTVGTLMGFTTEYSTGAVLQSALITDINDAVSNKVEAFALHQNYPNPCNPSTNVEVDIMKTSLVSLKVFDLLGREVATLLKGIHTAGTYHIPFNTSKLASGIYFYRLFTVPFAQQDHVLTKDRYGQVGSYVDIKKMIVLK